MGEFIEVVVISDESGAPLCRIDIAHAREQRCVELMPAAGQLTDEALHVLRAHVTDTLTKLGYRTDDFNWLNSEQ